MGMRFVHDTLPQRVRFATGEAAEQLAEEIAEHGYSRLMVIASTKDVAADLPVVVWHHEIAAHVPVEVAAAQAVDALVSIGGGATTGLAKAVALTTGVDDRVLPRTVVYDAALTLTLPVDLSVASGPGPTPSSSRTCWRSTVPPLTGLTSMVDAPVALRDHGMLEDGIPTAVEAVLAGDPVPVTTENLTALPRSAWAGDPPR
jgi:maleylacetate reductase